MIIQLKPSDVSFTEFLFNKLKKLDIILLCEGKTDVETVKAIVDKLNIEINLTIGITDCEGIDKVIPLTNAIILLARLSRKMKKLAILVNVETMDFEDRVKSIADSLNAHNLTVSELKRSAENESVFTLKIKPDGNRILPLIVAVSGIKEFNFEKHCIEDHAVKLMLLERKISSNELSKYSEAKQIISGNEIINEIKKAHKENIKRAFSHIVHLLVLCNN
ncbi:MAG: hypothetical protein J7L07_07895 [Candidatus Odinarchaeota archaeon]|nr:hypothetical protein [Candidatus Odinarchaeota archaeon]